MGQPLSLLPLRLRTGTGTMTFLVAVRAALRLPGFCGCAQHCGKLSVDLLAFCDKVFHAGYLGVDVQNNHLPSSVVKRLNVPPMRCHGSEARWSSVVAVKSGSTGATVLNRNWAG